MKKRIFVAIDISDEARHEVSNYISELRREFPDIKVGWDRPEKLHLTLKFLGDADDEQIKKLCEICLKISSEISDLKFEITKTGVFSSPQNARVLWLGIKGDVEELRKINSILESECEKIGFEKEKRNYRPHLTIGRIREPKKAFELAKAHLENKFEPVGFEVSEIVIYESELRPTGSVFQKIKGFSFSPR